MNSPSSTKKASGDRPIIAFTLGDIAGVGPEVAAIAASDEGIRTRCKPLLIGPAAAAERALAMCHWTGDVERVASCTEAVGVTDGVIPVLDVTLGTPVADCEESAAAGRAAYESICIACDAALSHEVEAIVTGPINKYSLRLAGVDVPGHTEILAERCGATDHAMMLYLPPGRAAAGPHGLGVAHVTLHTSIASVPELISKEAVVGKIELVDEFLQRIGCDQPRVGVAALNPHGGEQGLFGREEIEMIAPAVREAVAGSMHAVGPIPADALFRRAIAGEFDGAVAMYHDQGHIALKLVGFDDAVNVTLGLPIIRTSPSHGTAFDIAWKNEVDPAGMIAAAEVAAKLALDARPRLSR